MLPKTRINSKIISTMGWGVVTAFCVLSFLFLDRPLAILLKEQKPHWWNISLYNLTDYGRAAYYLVSSAVLFFLFFILSKKIKASSGEKYKKLSLKWLFVFVSVASAGISTTILKITLGRSRPRMLFSTGEYGFQGFNYDVDHWSFPSGHVTAVASFFVALFIITPPKYRVFHIPVSVFAFLIIVSRVTVQAHYLSDIVFSTYWGGSIAILVFILFSRLFPKYFKSL